MPNLSTCADGKLRTCADGKLAICESSCPADPSSITFEVQFSFDDASTCFGCTSDPIPSGTISLIYYSSGDHAGKWYGSSSSPVVQISLWCDDDNNVWHLDVYTLCFNGNFGTHPVGAISFDEFDIN